MAQRKHMRSNSNTRTRGLIPALLLSISLPASAGMDLVPLSAQQLDRISAGAQGVTVSALARAYGRNTLALTQTNSSFRLRSNRQATFSVGTAVGFALAIGDSATSSVQGDTGPGNLLSASNSVQFGSSGPVSISGSLYISISLNLSAN